MKSLLLVIDLQESFLNDNTKSVVVGIEDLINSNNYDYIAFTRFINNENSKWYKELNYKGCMTEEEQKIVIDTKDYPIFDKTTYTSLTKEVKGYIENNNVDTIYLCGIDTDACVLKTALDLFDYGYNVKVLENYCMSHSGKDIHNKAIDILKKLIGEDNIV